MDVSRTTFYVITDDKKWVKVKVNVSVPISADKIDALGEAFVNAYSDK